jgi:hypothetical protein
MILEAAQAVGKARVTLNTLNALSESRRDRSKDSNSSKGRENIKSSKDCGSDSSRSNGRSCSSSRRNGRRCSRNRRS